MQCLDVDEFISSALPSRRDVLPIDVAGHLLRCDSCRSLYRGLNSAYDRLRSIQKGTQITPALRNRVIAMQRKCSWPDLAS